MATMPTQADHVAALLRGNAGKEVRKHYLQKTVPQETTVMVVALTIDEGTETAVLAAIAANASVGFCEPVEVVNPSSPDVEKRSMRTPNWTPDGQEWEARVTFIGGHRVIRE